MPDPTQVELTVPAGSGDADFDAALVQAGADPATEPIADPPAPELAPVPETPAVDPDFTFATLENGQREMRLATGQVYRGKDDAELYGQLAKAQVAASRRITELSRPPEPIAPVASVATAATAIDPTALAIADLMAPAFGLKSGKELVEAFAIQQQTAQNSQEYMAAQQAQFEAAQFFKAVSLTEPMSVPDAEKIDQFLELNQLPFNAKTAEMAYYTLKAKGEMSAAPAPTTRAVAPKNAMPPPPGGTAPANTGKGAPTEADLWNMTSDQLAELLTANSTQ